MKLVIISGPSASGKTVIGEKLSSMLSYEFVSKDLIKEGLYNSQPRTTHDYLWYEKRAKNRFFEKISQNVSRNKSIIIESNFIKKDTKRLKPFLNTGTKIVEIHCTAQGLTRFRRYVRRNEKSLRHKGHHDRKWYLAILIEALLSYVGVKGPYKALNIGSGQLTVDTTDFSKVDYGKIAEFIRLSFETKF